MKHITKIFLIILFLFSSRTQSLELTVYMPIYEPLSKTNSNSIIGSSHVIINQKDIEKYQNTPLHKILEQETGIKSWSIYGSNFSGSKSTIDIRGMGAQAKSNVLILVNGQRLNNIDMSEIDFPSIPVESIDRIEVFKGSAASVLYGDGVIGGAINIITNPEFSKKSDNQIILKNGSFNNKEINFKNFQKIDNYNFNTYFNHAETDGYRDENEQQQNNFSSELKYPGSKGDHLFVINFNEQIMSTPSDRSQDELYTDRRGSDTPNDFINSIGGSLLYSSDYKFNDFITFILNSSFRLKDSYSDLQTSESYPTYSETSLKNYQLTPRVNHITNFFNKVSRLTYGLDLQYADYKSYRKKNKNVTALHIYDAWQSKQSLYVQQSVGLTDTTTLGTGLRLQRNSLAIGDILNKDAPDYSGWQTEHTTLSDHETNYAFNIGLDYLFNNNINFYGRLGNGFRYPNIDDRIGGSGDTSLELDTQTTRDLEIGTKYKSEIFTSNLSTYIIEGKNELGYDTDAFQNININSTRRYGLEFSTNYKISSKINLKNNFTFSKAKYTSGDQGTYATSFKGNDVPLVPQFSLDSNIEWKISEFLQIISIIKYQDDMRMESDDENFQHTKIPSYLIGDLSIISQIGNLTSTLSINNILDKKYFNYAVASSSTLGAYNAYPEQSREIIFSLGLKF